jgi:hypothetical protein
MKKIVVLCLMCAAGAALFARPEASAGANVGFPQKIQELVQGAVFGVVVKKVPDTRIVFDKELGWSVVPYLERTDGYYSTGTAFAVSPTEPATAFHVIDLGTKSLVYNDNYIGDGQKNV